MTLFGFCCSGTIKMVIGTLLIIWAFTALQPLWRFLHAIKGHWLTFFSNYLTLKRYRRRHPRGRQDVHELFDAKHLGKIGMAALPEEVAYVNPKLVKGGFLVKTFHLIWYFFRIIQRISSSPAATPASGPLCRSTSLDDPYRIRTNFPMAPNLSLLEIPSPSVSVFMTAMAMSTVWRKRLWWSLALQSTEELGLLLRRWKVTEREGSSLEAT